MLMPSFNLRIIGPAFSEVQITPAKTKYLAKWELNVEP